MNFAISIAVAMVLGSVIGLERQWRSSPAGLRTNTLVAMGAAMYVSIGALMGVKDVRIAAQIVSGIGFIGGGAILREGLSIRGVSTAATLWCSAAVGALCGAGMLAEAGTASGAILFVNLVLRPISHRLTGESKLLVQFETRYDVQFTVRAAEESRVRKEFVAAVAATDLIVTSVQSTEDGAADRLLIDAVLVSPKKDDHTMERIVAGLIQDPAATRVRWEAIPEKVAHD